MKALVVLVVVCAPSTHTPRLAPVAVAAPVVAIAIKVAVAVAEYVTSRAFPCTFLPFQLHFSPNNQPCNTN